MNDDVLPGRALPDIRLPDHVGNERWLGELVGGDPAVVQFYRGWWCPKEHAFFRLGLRETTDTTHDPYAPTVFVLRPDLEIHSVDNGYWFWGRPANEELRRDLREISRSIRPDWEVP